VPVNYDFEKCPSYLGGINFVGCEKWLRSWIDGDSYFNTSTGAYEVYPASGDLCLNEDNQVYDVLSEHLSQYITSLVFYDAEGLPTGTGVLSPDYWIFQEDPIWNVNNGHPKLAKVKEAIGLVYPYGPYNAFGDLPTPTLPSRIWSDLHPFEFIYKDWDYVLKTTDKAD
jgi:hypothetical protein